jgi:hypothetical protein
MGWTRLARAKIVRPSEPRNIRSRPNSCAANTVVQQNKGDYEKQHDHESDGQGEQSDKNFLHLILPQDHWHRRQTQQSKENPLPSPVHHFAYAVSVASHNVAQGAFLVRNSALVPARTSTLQLQPPPIRVFANESYTVACTPRRLALSIAGLSC